MQYVIGIDAGGTSTRAWLASEDGEVAAAAAAGPANLQRAGAGGLVGRIASLTRELQSKLPYGSRIARMEVGAAGLGREPEKQAVLSALHDSGLACGYGVQSDVAIALFAAVQDGAGIVLIAGTGSIAAGRSAQGTYARAGGWGWIIGDEGSGYEVGRAALRAVARAADGRGPQTSITARLLHHFQVKTVQDLIPAVYGPPLAPNEIARLAAIVGAEAKQGDRVAVDILQRAGRELAVLTRAVAERLHLPHPAVYYGGGLFRLGDPVLKPLSSHLRACLPNAGLQPLPLPPVAGAVLLALHRMRPLTPEQTRRVHESAARLQGRGSSCID